VPGVPLADGTTDLVYTGKGALIWMPDSDAWAREVARLLRPGGHLFVYEGHPAVPLWTWDEDTPNIRADRSYFARCHVNDTFPARGASEWQWTLGQVVTAVITGGMELLSLAEYPQPFWRPGGVRAAASARRRPAPTQAGSCRTCTSAAVGHEQVPQPGHLEESHPDADGSRRTAAAVLRTLGLGETGRQMTRTAGAV